MWKRAKERYEAEQAEKTAEACPPVDENAETADPKAWEEKEQRFASILSVPTEERDRVQRMQVVDRAAAALAAAQALMSEPLTFQNSAATFPSSYSRSVSESVKDTGSSYGTPLDVYQGDQPEKQFSSISSTKSTLGAHAAPGPDFWTWSPPPIDQQDKSLMEDLKASKARPSSPFPALLEKEASTDFLVIPFESVKTGNESKSEELPLIFQSRAKPSLPPLQSLLQAQKIVGASEESNVTVDSAFPEVGAEVASFLKKDKKSDANLTHGVNSDGSRWWKETGKELHNNGIQCTWTVIRGVNADGVEWEEKFWEAFDDLDYKELGAEKSGRDASGNVWREFWKEAMWQDLATGLLHIEKTADKWAKNGQAGEWHEKWWERYDASGRAEKWADKWSKIDPATQLEPGHAHVWHERWGENFDGEGGAVKYTDKWAERAEFGGVWSKWGDKWDEHFNKYGHGVKQGETWWEGTSGERWNRTWGEQHNGTGWVHKYGQSSSGEHWDTHEQQETWYERQPHFGFHHCLENSQELQRVGKKRNFKL